MWGAGAVSISTTAKTFPAGSTSPSANAWENAGAPNSYPTSATDYTINSNGSWTLYNAADYGSSDGLQLKASGGYIQTTISSSAGVDIVVGYNVGKNNIKLTLTGATEDVTGSSTSANTASISTTSTSATFKILKEGKGAGYIKYITITPKASSKTLSSISVQTAPTKVKYVAGENFDPTGLIITRNYSSGSPDTYTYASHTSEFSFTPSTSTALTTSNTLVSITYGGKSTSQAINVYNVTMQARDEDGNAIPAGGPGAPSRTGKSITPAADANNYVFKQWQVTNASLGSGATAKSNTITNPTGAVIVTAVYYKPIPVSWNKNGSLYETTYTGYNQKPVFPENPSSCDLTSNTFYGWATSTWDNTVDNLAGKTVYTSASSMPNVTAIGVVYNAVFAKVSEGAASWTKVTNSISAGDIIVLVNETASKELTSIGDINGTSCGKTSAYSTTPTGTFPLTVETGNGGNGFSFKNGSNYLSWSSGNSLITSTTINNASSWTINNPSNGNYTFSNIGDNTRKLQYNSGSPRFCCYTSSQQAFQIYKRSVNITYSKYLTSCCTPLAQVEGSVNLNQLSPNPVGGKLKASWQLAGTTGIGSLKLQLWKKGSPDVKVGEDINVTVNTTAQTHTFEGLDYCATYYAKLIAAKDGGTYCTDGWTKTSDEITTIGYAVELTDDGTVTGGTFTTNKARACAGDEVTLTATPGSGYLLGGWTVFDGNTDEITPTSTENNTFVFEMPASGVVAEATFCTQPTAPTGLSRTLNADATRGKTVLSWNSVTGATGYVLNYTKDAVAQTPIDVNATSYTFNPLAVGTYTWSVKAKNACGESDAANGEGFIICTDLSSTTPTVGAASSIAQTTATANWTAVAGAAKYTVQVYKGNDKVKEFENETGTSKAITGLTANTTYVVKVTAYNACDEASLAGASASFTTLKNVYTVSFDANGGTGSIEAVNVTDGETTTLPSNGFTKAGFSLSGWKVNNEGALLEKGASYTVTGAATLYAQWSPNTINVTYKPNGLTADEVAESFTYGEEYNAKAANTFSREGYQFKHWNNAADGSGAVTLAAGAAYTGTEDIDLYAIWDQLYTVRWVVNGTTKSTQTAIAGAALTAPYAPQTSDCDNSKVFVGWTETQHYTDATDAPADLFDYANTLTMPAGGATYYAVFANVEEGSELQDKELEITISNFTEITTSYDTKYTHTYSVAASSGNTDVNVEALGVYNNSNGIQMNKGKGTYIKNTDALPGYIKQIKMTWTATGKNSPTLYANANAVASTSSTNLGTQANDETEQIINITNPATANYKYFYFDGTTVTGACYMSSLKITYAVEVDATVRTNYATDCNTVLPVCETPTFNIEEGEYTVVKNVTIETATEGATIYYTTDGSNPATSETKQIYSSAVRVDHTLTLKAVAVKENYVNSTVKSAEYTINLPQCATPTFSVAAGRYTETKSVELSCETEGADIYYTTDGETPTTGSTKYTEAISVATNMTIKAVAIAENTTLSEVASATYKIVGPGSTLWELVESTNDLNDGDIIVIASNTQGKTTNSTITTSNSANYFGEEVATFSEDKSEITELSDDAQQFTLGKSENYWTLSNGTQYLKETAVKKLAWDNNTFNWAISIDETTHAATISNSNTAGDRILHNVTNNRFTTYSSDLSATMLLPQIYRKTVICVDPETELAFASSVPTAIDASEKAQLATTGGNGNTVAYSVISNNANAASIDNQNKFSAVVAGTYTVQARQTVSNDYKCAQTATIDIVVTVAATSIELNKTELSLEEGQFETLVATVKPNDASNKNVTWSVTEGSTFIEVDQTGKVTAKAIGNGTVQVETEDGHFTATCAVTVTAPTPTLTLTTTNPLAFGNVEQNLTKDLTVNLKGSYLAADVSYEITGDNVFTLETALDNDAIGSEDGQTLTIRFAPTAEGNKSATITFSSGVASQTLTVTGIGKKRYTATLHAGNGSVTSGTIQESSIGSGITLPEATLSQKLQDGGWSFAGWSETELSDETTEVPTTIDAGEYAIAADIDLYAVYTRSNIVEKTASKNSGFSAYSNVTIEEGKPIKFTASNGSGESNHVRVHANATLTVNGNGTTVKKVEFVSLNNYKATNFTVNDVSLTGEVWEGSATSVVFTATKQVRFSSIAVTYQTSEGLFTTYPAELLAIEFDLNGGTGNFPSQTVVKGSSYTIDAAEPTKPNHDFIGWNDGSTTYQAAETIENVQDNITLTAQWDEWAKATTITFKNGETTVDTKENIYKGASYTTPAAPVVEGKLFQGWSDGVNTYAAETEVAVPNDLTENITITYNALWKDVLPIPEAPAITAADLANGEWVLVTANNQIKEGDVVIVASTVNAGSFALSTTQEDKYRARTTATISGNKLTATDEMAKLFVQVGYGDNQYALYAINDQVGYLYAVNGNNYLRTKSELTPDASWTITIDENSHALIRNGAYTSYSIRYNTNANQERFSCYTGSQQDVALYKWVKKISENMNISNVTLTDAVIVEDGAKLTVDAASTLDNLTVEAGGKVETTNELTVINNLTIESEAGKSGQVSNAGKVHANNVYMDVKFYKTAETLDATSANQWYMISAPFDVNLNGGFFQTDGTPMVFTVAADPNSFDLFEYNGSKRASTGKTGWKRASGKMKAGVAYLIGFEAGQSTTIRLKAANTTMTDKDAITLNTYTSTIGTEEENAKNSNWNGVANPNLHYISINKDAQTYDNDARSYNPSTSGSTSYVVGTAFFIHGDEDAGIVNTIHDDLRAPRRATKAQPIEFCVRLQQENASWANRMYIRASEEASAHYEAGRDLETMNGTNGNNALLWSNNYGMRLAIEEAPIVNDKASYALSLYAPANGTYRIETPTENDNADLYLTKDGRVIWNLSMNGYEVELTKGTTEGYGLLLVRKAPSVATGVDEVESQESKAESAEKVIIDEHVYILRDGQMYDVTGKAVK